MPTNGIDLIPPGVSFDDRGRMFSPFIERGSDNVPRAVNVPTAAQLKGMSTGQLTSVANRFGYSNTIDEQMRIHGGFLNRFGIMQGDPRWDAEMSNLQGNIKRSLVGHTRQLAQRHETLSAIDGKTNTEMIYINESAEPCEECEPLGGTEGTYAWFVESGNLPGDRCLGGANCLCTLSAVG